MAIRVAAEIDAEIVSVDSMQVYRGMDVGTAKPTVIERRGVTHHMIDIVDPSVEYTVAEFRRRGKAVISSADKPLIITGGSGLHFRSLVDPLSFAPTDPNVRSELESAPHDELVSELLDSDPSAGLHVDLANPRRVIRAVEITRLSGETPSQRAASEEANAVRRYEAETEFTAIGVDPGEKLDERIDARLHQMREGGFVQEVRGLAGRLSRTAERAVGYREVLSHLAGDLTEAEAFSQTALNTKQLAKKQRTWFQRDPRIRWIPWSDDSDVRAERAIEELV